jgi:hypothetical protein
MTVIDDTQQQLHRAHPGLAGLEESLRPVRQSVIAHPVYRGVDSLPKARAFMESHVFAVWDFMSLLKVLQRELTCIRVPWVPEGSSASRRLINEIVLGEESDEVGGGYTSHFELYLDAMAQAGADRGPIDAFIRLLRTGHAVSHALAQSGAPQGASWFVASTWRFIEQTPLHCQAAAFAFGREDLIPEMFEQVAGIPDPDGALTVFKDYLVRHIELDGDLHTPMAMRMLVDLCGDDPAKWADCADAAAAALAARAELWTSVARGFADLQ